MLKIKDWSRRFEDGASRRVKRLPIKTPVPVGIDAGDIEILNHPNGAAHFGAWMAIVRISAQQDCQSRGMLPAAPGRNPHDIAGICGTLSGMSNIPVAVFEELIPRLLSDKIAWLEEVDERGKPVKSTVKT